MPGIDHYENFPVASLVCPARLRAPIMAIYAFARTADDIADEGSASTAQRLADLQAYRADLQACQAPLQNSAASAPFSARWHGIFSALQKQIAAHALPMQLLDDLLSAFERDIHATAQGHWPADTAELLDYCRLSANPVGRLLLHLYSVSAPAALAESDAICSALQLINFWQDPSRDIPNRRFYFPLDKMAQHGVQKADLLAQIDSQNTINLIANLSIDSEANMQKGLQLPSRVQKQLGGLDGWRASLELRCVIQGGLRILQKIGQLQHRTLRQRPRLGLWDACVVVWRALRM